MLVHAHFQRILSRAWRHKILSNRVGRNSHKKTFRKFFLELFLSTSLIRISFKNILSPISPKIYHVTSPPHRPQANSQPRQWISCSMFSYFSLAWAMTWQTITFRLKVEKKLWKSPWDNEIKFAFSEVTTCRRISSATQWTSIEICENGSDKVKRRKCLGCDFHSKLPW